MHLTTQQAKSRSNSASCSNARALDFLWLELTNRCNLQCVHCYTESHPYTGDRDLLTQEDYASLMTQAQALGCRKIQFIGGEPLLNPAFQALLVKAKTIGFEFIEVFSNLTRLDDKSIHYAADNGICFATSVYSDDSAQHDAVTRVKSSHARTIGNLKKLITAGIDTRVAIIAIDQDKDSLSRTSVFLRELGVRHVRYGITREFGRGETIRGQSARLSGLCGHCWNGKLCIAPDGEAYPCVMARKWPIGNVLEKSLGEIVAGQPLEDIRQTIFDNVWIPKASFKRGNFDELALSTSDSSPNGPTCGPDTGAPDCAPELNPRDEPDFEKCPQSCNPDLSTCGPCSCPQSCAPNMIE